MVIVGSEHEGAWHVEEWPEIGEDCGYGGGFGDQIAGKHHKIGFKPGQRSDERPPFVLPCEQVCIGDVEDSERPSCRFARSCAVRGDDDGAPPYPIRVRVGN